MSGIEIGYTNTITIFMSKTQSLAKQRMYSRNLVTTMLIMCQHSLSAAFGLVVPAACAGVMILKHTRVHAAFSRFNISECACSFLLTPCDTSLYPVLTFAAN